MNKNPAPFYGLKILLYLSVCQKSKGVLPVPGYADSKLRLILSYFAIYVVWGSTYLGIKIALETAPMFFVGASRFTVSGLFLMGCALWRGCRIPTAANWKIAAKSGLLSFFVAFGVLTWAQKSLPSSIAALIISLEPIWFILMDWLFFGGPRPGWRIYAAQAFGFLGCALLIMAEPDSQSVTGVSQLSYILSALGVVLCGLAWVYGSLISRSPDSHSDTTMASGMQMLTGGAALTAASLMNGELAQLGGISLRSGVAMMYLALFGSIFAYSAFVFLLRTQPASRIAPHAFVNPVIAVFLGWLFAGEAITPLVIVAAALIVVSVLLTIYAPTRPAHKP